MRTFLVIFFIWIFVILGVVASFLSILFFLMAKNEGIRKKVFEYFENKGYTIFFKDIKIDLPMFQIEGFRFSKEDISISSDIIFDVVKREIIFYNGNILFGSGGERFGKNSDFSLNKNCLSEPKFLKNLEKLNIKIYFKNFHLSSKDYIIYFEGKGDFGRKYVSGNFYVYYSSLYFIEGAKILVDVSKEKDGLVLLSSFQKNGFNFHSKIFCGEKIYGDIFLDGTILLESGILISLKTENFSFETYEGINSAQGNINISISKTKNKGKIDFLAYNSPIKTIFENSVYIKVREKDKLIHGEVFGDIGRIMYDFDFEKINFSGNINLKNSGFKLVKFLGDLNTSGYVRMKNFLIYANLSAKNFHLINLHLGDLSGHLKVGSDEIMKISALVRRGEAHILWNGEIDLEEEYISSSGSATGNIKNIIKIFSDIPIYGKSKKIDFKIYGNLSEKIFISAIFETEKTYAIMKEFDVAYGFITGDVKTSSGNFNLNILASGEIKKEKGEQREQIVENSNNRVGDKDEITKEEIRTFINVDDRRWALSITGRDIDLSQFNIRGKGDVWGNLVGDFSGRTEGLLRFLVGSFRLVDYPIKSSCLSADVVVRDKYFIFGNLCEGFQFSITFAKIPQYIYIQGENVFLEFSDGNILSAGKVEDILKIIDISQNLKGEYNIDIKNDYGTFEFDVAGSIGGINFDSIKAQGRKEGESILLSANLVSQIFSANVDGRISQNLFLNVYPQVVFGVPVDGKLEVKGEIGNPIISGKLEIKDKVVREENISQIFSFQVFGGGEGFSFSPKMDIFVDFSNTRFIYRNVNLVLSGNIKISSDREVFAFGGFQIIDGEIDIFNTKFRNASGRILIQKNIFVDMKAEKDVFGLDDKVYKVYVSAYGELDNLKISISSPGVSEEDALCLLVSQQKCQGIGTADIFYGAIRTQVSSIFEELEIANMQPIITPTKTGVMRRFKNFSIVYLRSNFDRYEQAYINYPIFGNFSLSLNWDNKAYATNFIGTNIGFDIILEKKFSLFR